MAEASVLLMNMLVPSVNMAVNITLDVIPKSLIYNIKAESQVWSPVSTPQTIGLHKSHSSYGYMLMPV